MIRIQITTTNPVALNTAAKILAECPRLEIEKDSGNRSGKKGYLRYIHTKILNKVVSLKPKRSPIDRAHKILMAQRCWDKIVHKTDSDDDAVQAIVELIEYVENL